MKAVGSYYNKRYVWEPGELKAYLAEQRALTRASRNRADEDYKRAVIEASRASQKRLQLESIVNHTANSERLQRAGAHQGVFTVTEDIDVQYDNCIKEINVPMILEGVHK